jgi:hypothetical protein
LLKVALDIITLTLIEIPVPSGFKSSSELMLYVFILRL